MPRQRLRVVRVRRPILRSGNVGIKQVGKDDDTCSAPAQSFSKSVKFPAKVVKARIYLTEEDRDTGMPRDAIKTSKVWGNPYVGR